MTDHDRPGPTKTDQDRPGQTGTDRERPGQTRYTRYTSLYFMKENHKNRNSYHLNPITECFRENPRRFDMLIMSGKVKMYDVKWLSTYSMMMMKKVGLNEALFTS